MQKNIRCESAPGLWGVVCMTELGEIQRPGLTSRTGRVCPWSVVNSMRNPDGPKDDQPSEAVEEWLWSLLTLQNSREPSMLVSRNSIPSAPAPKFLS